MPVLKPIKLILVCAGIAGLWQGAGVVKADSGDLLANLSPVSDAMLAAPPSSDWLMWRRTYDGFGFSPLDQITKAFRLVGPLTKLKESFGVVPRDGGLSHLLVSREAR